MLWLLLSLLLVRLVCHSGVDYQNLLSYTQPLHSLCTESLKARGFHPIYEGLLCGEGHLPATTVAVFKQSGLYHLLVVSGSHFVFLEQALLFLVRTQTKEPNRARLAPWIIALFVLFAALCQFNPPVTRALVSLILQGLSQKFRLFWRREQVALYSGVLCLCLFPEWFLSLSLLLSWLASLALTFARKSHYQHILIFLFIYPIFYNSSAFAILNNILFTPVFSVFYFPMTLLTALLPYGSVVGNFIWQHTLNFMTLLPGTTNIAMTASPQLLLLWVYTFSLHVLKRLLHERSTGWR